MLRDQQILRRAKIINAVFGGALPAKDPEFAEVAVAVVDQQRPRLEVKLCGGRLCHWSQVSSWRPSCSCQMLRVACSDWPGKPNTEKHFGNQKIASSPPPPTPPPGKSKFKNLSRPYSRFLESMMTVAGPSLVRVTCMFAPNSPVLDWAAQIGGEAGDELFVAGHGGFRPRGAGIGRGGLPFLVLANSVVG